MLGNTARLTTGHPGFANIVEQGRLAVINMAHHGDDGCSGFGCALLAGQRFLEAFLNLFVALEHNAMAEFFNHQRRRILIEHLIDRGHHAKVHQLFNHFTCFDRHLLGQIADGDVLGNAHVINNFFGGLLKGMLVGLIGELFAPASTTTRNTRLCRFKVINRKVVATLLTARARDTTALQATFTRPATQLVPSLGVVIF